jgi:DNA helicase MCM9
VLVDFFRLHRAAAGRSAARTTVRMLQGLVRLAQAHARLMMRQLVTEQDAIIAVALSLSLSLSGCVCVCVCVCVCLCVCVYVCVCIYIYV